MTTYAPRTEYLLTAAPEDADLDLGATFAAHEFGFTAAFGHWPAGATFEQRTQGELVTVWTVCRWTGTNDRNVLQSEDGKLREFSIVSSLPKMRRHKSYETER